MIPSVGVPVLGYGHIDGHIFQKRFYSTNVHRLIGSLLIKTFNYHQVNDPG